MSSEAPPARDKLSAFAMAAMTAGTGLFALLHVLPSTEGISAVEDTISEYAFTSAQWLFNLAIALIGVGSAAVFVALVRRRAVPAFSVTSVSASLWIAGLAVIVVFEKTDWDVGPSTTGTIHRIASIFAFVALPLAVIAGARALFRDAPLWRGLTQLLGLTSWLWFALILAAVARMMAGGPPWWQALPLGLVERGMALNEVLAVAVLAIGMLSGRPERPRTADTRAQSADTRARDADTGVAQG